ncbi:hypothetical protein [Pseudoxanthomonas mexicana]|uniref:hypothetical protein n=1 Tax=Pseudoxanthomonas mexicana TaxID=128785 RepID=UPI0028A227BE|nr:hypothetical protein [Pseudoxanthomonas mexicana]
MAANVVYKRKKVLIDAPPPVRMELPAAWADNDLLVSPQTKSTVFGNVSALRLGRDQIIAPAAPVYLRCGAHFGPNWGFGFRHIWKEHFSHVPERDEAAHQISAFVAQLLKKTTPVHYDQDSQEEGRTKATALRVLVGLAVIEYLPAEALWSVVTAYRGRNTKGPAVGSLV